MSNSKLNADQKIERKIMIEDYSNVELFAFPECNCVVGIERTGETMGRFAVSISAETEQKFRRKVGEYNVLNRFADEYTQPVYIGTVNVSGLAGDIAYMLGRCN